jgi:hypothetical protein
MLSTDPNELTVESGTDISLRPEEKDRIEDLLQRYDSLLAQADELNLQIESLLKDWNATREQSPPTNP